MPGRLADPKVIAGSQPLRWSLGAAAAARESAADWSWLILTAAAVFLVEVAKNASGEVFDFDSGVDQAVAPEDRSPSRAASA